MAASGRRRGPHPGRRANRPLTDGSPSVLEASPKPDADSSRLCSPPHEARRSFSTASESAPPPRTLVAPESEQAMVPKAPITAQSITTGLSRRNFLGVLGLAGGAVVLSPVLAACGDGSSSGGGGGG